MYTALFWMCEYILSLTDKKAILLLCCWCVYILWLSVKAGYSDTSYHVYNLSGWLKFLCGKRFWEIDFQSGSYKSTVDSEPLNFASNHGTLGFWFSEMHIERKVTEGLWFLFFCPLQLTFLFENYVDEVLKVCYKDST